MAFVALTAHSLIVLDWFSWTSRSSN